MTNLAAAPVLLPIATALALLALPRRSRWGEPLSLASGAVLLGIAVTLAVLTWDGRALVLPIGSWSPRIGIVWVVDRLSAAMLLLAAVTSLAILVYAPAADPDVRRRPWFLPLHQLLLVGINGSFVTGDLFNLFVFFEIMLVASFVLTAFGDGASRLEQAFPYVVVNLLASMLLFAGVGLVYGATGTVNMAELSARLRELTLAPTVGAGIALVLAVFAIKAALVPFFFWLPDAYPRASLPVSAFFAGMLTKVGVYALFRTVPLFSSGDGRPVHQVLLAIAGATMLVGVLGALGRNNIRGILSFHIISQVGYMVFGLALFSPIGVAAGFFYVVHHIVVKTALFLAGGVAELAGGGALGASRGLARRRPWAGVAFFVPAMALAGIPPLSGFWGKLFLIIAGFRAGAYVTTGIAVLVSFLTLASMLKIWFARYWGAPGGPEPPRSPRLLAPALLLAALSLAIGASAPLLYPHAERTALELLTPQTYIDQVRAAWPAEGAPRSR